MTTRVHHHASVAIVESQTDTRFLFSRYGSGYPGKIFRESPNLIGGNHEQSDKGPLDLMTREIREEFSVGEPRDSYASESEIVRVRDEILESLCRFMDFIITVPPVKRGMTINDVLFSAYSARISNEAMDIVSRNLADGKRFLTEGNAAVLRLDEIMDPANYSAWGTPIIMRVYLKEEIPNLLQIKGATIGFPKEKFVDYLEQFSYEVPVRV